MENFKQFDAVTDASDHPYFASNNYGKQITQQVSKQIYKEWKILEENLPESSIFVRVYEDRIDLLRAVILGPSGTPYHSGLFFFDICFPSAYPAVPPQVNYRSFGYRLNPNLYNNGTVCLSLLNTWFGKKNQKWNPSQSTILQVLVSIQALVLNEMPYYNEPVYAHTKRDKAARAYNEDVWVYNCKTMTHLLHKPPKHFDQFILEHFRDNADAILRACKAYVYGRRKVGTSSCSPCKVSEKFKSSMIILWPLLLNNFALYLGESSVEKFRAEPMLIPQPRKSGDGIAKKFWSKLLEIGCMKMTPKKKENANAVAGKNVKTQAV